MSASYRRWVVLVALMVMVAACTTDTTPTTTATTLPPGGGTTSTTLPDLCPDAFCIEYTIRDGASWSDGQPVTADDFAHTISILQARSEPVNPGYALITGVEVVDSMTLLVAMSEVFAAWMTLFEVIYPAHAEYDPVMPGPTNGPFRLESWDDEIVLARNPHYVSDEFQGDVEKLRFVVASGVRDMVSGLDTGRYHVINPVPQDWVLDDLNAITHIGYTVHPGAFWEHITFNHDDPMLAREFVREAIATAIDREAILDATVRRVDPPAEPLVNTIWMPDSIFHSDHFGVSHDVTRAEQLLADNGCQRGGDGVFVCEGQRLSFIWATTTGDPDRETQLDMAAAMLRSVGIEIIPWRLAPADLFSTPIFFGDSSVWQIMSFAWHASADPFLNDAMYQCVGEGPHGMGLLNAGRYCNDAVDTLIRSASAEPDPTARADLYNRVDRLFLEDIAMIPLYQRPQLLAYSGDLSRVVPNPWATDLWNVGGWTGMSEVVVALESPPGSLTSPVDKGAAMIMQALYQGAFSIHPGMEFVSSLIESVQLIADNVVTEATAGDRG